MPPEPALDSVAQEVVDATTPFDLDAEETDYAWRLLVDAIVTPLFQEVADYASDTDDEPGWSTMLSPATAPEAALGFLSQFTGTILTDEMSEAEKREAIAVPEGFRRGSLPALIAAVKRTLTGAQTVLVDERYTGDAYQLRIRTLESETPSDAASIAAALTQKPIGIALTFDSVVGQDWDDVVSKYATWDAVVAAHATWDSLVAELP